MPVAKTALLVVDMINAYDFEDADKLVESAREAVPNIEALIGRARDESVPVIYVNDNFGRWNSSPSELVEEVLGGEHRDLLEPLMPDEDAQFVVKARHSCFYETPLEYLLRNLGVGRVMLCGQVTEQCILYSALDAYVRHFDVAVPPDAVAHIDSELADAALEMMRRNMRADAQPVVACRF
jgi:nicotinamidase-related amidase